MIKNKVSMEMEIDGKVVCLLCDNDTSLGILHDALHRMLGYVVSKINEANSKQEQSEPQED